MGRGKLARADMAPARPRTELLSPGSKLAATHAQCVNDPVAVDAVNEIEIVASNLSSKIWQKIVILDTISGLEGRAGDGCVERTERSRPPRC